MTTRNQQIDFLKGLAAILVVFGHVIQSGCLDYGANPLFKIIYSFHMPLFMFLSGFVSYFSFKNHKGAAYLLTRFVQLIVPFLVWGLLSVSFKSVLSLCQGGGFLFFDDFKALLLVPEHGLWFLWVLFVFNILHFFMTLLMQRITNARVKKLVATLIASAIIVIYASRFPDYFGLVNIGKLLPFYALGWLSCWLKEEKNCHLINKDQKIKSFIVYALSLVLLLVCVSFTVLKKMDYLLDYDFVKTNYFAWLLNKTLLFAVSIVWILVLILITKLFPNDNVFVKGVAMFGNYSLDLYVLQLFPMFALEYLFARITIDSALFTFVLSPIIAITLSFLLMIASKYVIRRLSVTSLLLLGRKKANTIN